MSGLLKQFVCCPRLFISCFGVVVVSFFVHLTLFLLKTAIFSMRASNSDLPKPSLWDFVLLLVCWCLGWEILAMSFPSLKASMYLPLETALHTQPLWEDGGLSKILADCLSDISV